MPNVPVKILERLLKEHGVNVQGVDVIQCIGADMMEEAKELGMDKGINESFEFFSTYDMDDCKLTFNVEMVEDVKNHPTVGEVTYYYTQVHTCKIEKGGKEQTINMEGLYWE